VAQLSRRRNHFSLGTTGTMGCKRIKPERVTEIQYGILHGQTSGFFSHEPFETITVMIIQDSDFLI